MKKFLYLQAQKGQGCDYTIGCGFNWDYIDAESKEDAIEQIVDLPEDWQEITDSDKLSDVLCCSGLMAIMDDEYNSSRLVTAELIEVADETNLIPIMKQFLKKVQSYKDNLEATSKLQEEEKEFERLKKKLGK